MNSSSTIAEALSLTREALTNIFASPENKVRLQDIFSQQFDLDAAWLWLGTEINNNFINFPTIEIRPAEELYPADGAYGDTEKIYLSAEFIARVNSPDAIFGVILEEYGHFLDARFNSIDTPGDEGELFSSYIQGKTLTDLQIQAIATENDRATVTINNELVQIEQANPGDNPAFDLIGLTQLRNDPQFAGIDGSGFSVAVIDTGIDKDHPLIAPNYVAGYDFIDDDNEPLDLVGHGTHVAGTIGATDETIGVAPNVDSIALRVLDGENAGLMSEVEAALEWVEENRDRYNITAVNLSFSTGFFASDLELQEDIIFDNIRSLEAAGVTVVSATGNEYFANSDSAERANIGFPAIFSTLAVGAVWQDGTKENAVWQGGSIDRTTGADRITSFSQRLDAPNTIFAPGAIITSTLPGGKIGEYAGTSHAAPHVAGAVALLQEASLQFGGRLLTPAEVREILRATGDPIIDGDNEDDNVSNTNGTYLRLNIYSAISEVKRRNDDLDGSITRANKITTLPISEHNGGGLDSLTTSDASPSPASLPAEIGRDGDRILGDRDIDFYRFNSEEAGILEIEVNSQVKDPVNSVISLFDGEGKRLSMSDRAGSNDSQLRFAIAADTDYYVAVTGFGNEFDPLALGVGTGGDTGAYTIDGSLKPLSADELADNTINDLAVQTITSGETLFGNLGNDSGSIVGDIDVDIYRFAPDVSGTVNIKTTTDEDSADTYLRAFDESGNEIAASSSIQLEAIAGTEYYIGVNGNEAEYDPITGEGTASGSQGNYNLRVSSENDLVSGATVYRFFRPDTGVHFYTASELERDSIINNLSDYTYEGASYIAAAETADPITQAKPVYRFFNTHTGAHLYTMSEQERDSVNNTLSNYTYEGIAYYGYESDRPGAAPLYRFYNPETDAHFYTPSKIERDTVLSDLPDYQLESDDGIAFYVEPVAEI